MTGPSQIPASRRSGRRGTLGPRRLVIWLVTTALAASALVVAATSFGLFVPGTGAEPVTYYLSPSGNDGASGTSPQAAWRTLARASRAVLRPGDRLLLRAGGRFSGELTISPPDAGRASRPVIVSSYGTGRATISGRSSGIVVTDTAGLDVSDLRITSGAGSGGGPGAGINLFSDLRGHRRLDHVEISGVDISGFAYGVLIGARGDAGFRDVRISGSAMHDNVDAGISSYGPAFDAASPSYPHARIDIVRDTVFRNLGDPRNSRGNTGNGIVLGGVADSRISWSTAYENGGRGKVRTEGPIGIWTYDSTRVMIDHDLAYANRSPNIHDGGGFGLDQNTSLCTLQYDLAYDNWGAGFLLYSGQRNQANQGDVARFDISSGDSLVPHESGGITVAGWVRDAAVYQNTVVTGRWAGGPHAPLRLGASITGVTVRNNILMAAARPGPLVIAPSDLSRRQVLLQGNDYAAAKPPAGPLGGSTAWSVRWGSAAYSSLGAWRAGTGQETLAGRPVGVDADPRLVGPVLGLTARAAGTAGRGAGFELAPRSPVSGAGLDLPRLFHVDPGPVDFSGHRISPRRLNIGAQ